MTEHEKLRRWACEWTGNGKERALRDGGSGRMSDADLSEAVRVKFMASDIGKGMMFDPSIMWDDLGWRWLNSGSIAFIARARKIVEANK